MNKIGELQTNIPIDTPSVGVSNDEGIQLPVNIVPGPSGSLLQTGSLKSVRGSQNSFWSLNADGTIDVGGSHLLGLSISANGVNGLLINTTGILGVGEYVFSSAGFFMPGGFFTGTVTIIKSDTHLVFRVVEASDDTTIGELIVEGVPYGPTAGGLVQLALDSPTFASSSSVVQAKIAIAVGGTQYYILASTGTA